MPNKMGKEQEANFVPGDRNLQARLLNLAQGGSYIYCHDSLVLLSPALPCPALSCLVLSYPTLPAKPCPALPDCPLPSSLSGTRWLAGGSHGRPRA